MNDNQQKIADLLAEDTLGKKIRDTIKNEMNYILIAIISTVFITSCCLVFTPNTDIKTILSNCSIGTLVGWIIKTLLHKQGSTKAFETKRMIQMQESYDKIVADNNKDSEYYQPFCEIENEISIKNYQRQILAQVNLVYEKFVNGDYDGKTYKNIKGEDLEFTKLQKSALNKAKHPKIFMISPDYLTNEASISIITIEKEESLKKHEAKNNGKNFVSMVITALLLGFLGVGLISGEQLVAEIIWKILQILIYLAFGFFEYFKAFGWVTNEYYGYLKRRYDYLVKFQNMIKNKDSLLWKRVEQLQKGDN